MLRTRLPETTTFRLTLLHLGAFSLSALALLGFIYSQSVRFMEAQTEQTIQEELDWIMQQRELGGEISFINSVQSLAQVEPNRRSVYVLTDHAGRILAGNLNGLPNVSPDAEGLVRFEVEVTEPSRHRAVHDVIAKLTPLGSGGVLLIGRDVEEKLHIQNRLLSAILAGGGLMLLFGVVGGWLTSRWMLYRLEVVNRTTARIVAGDLSQRVAVKGGGDEFDELAENVNAMLERIERLLVGMRQVTDDIAHDLRTPLNRLRSRIEVALMGDLSNAEARDLLDATMHDADNLIDTFNALLNIARAEAGAQRSEWERIDLSELARDVCELYEPLAEENGLTLELDAGEPVEVLGNYQLVAQAIANITDNAIKYTPAGGRVVVRTRATPAPCVSVLDNGPGIPDELKEQAKERFVRLDSTRSSAGSGLGLSLVNAVAKLHEAKLVLSDADPGLEVALTFRPAPQPASGAARSAPRAEVPASAGQEMARPAA